MIRVFLMLSCEDDLCHRQADAWLHGEGKANRILTVAWRSSLPCPRYVLLSWSQKTKRRQILFEAQIQCCRCCFSFHCGAETRRSLTYSPHHPLVCFMCLLNILLRFTDIYRPSFAIPTWRLLQDTLRFCVPSQCWKSRKRSRRSARWPLALEVFDKTSHHVSPFCIDLAIETRNKSGQVPQAQEQVFPSEVIKIDVKVSNGQQIQALGFRLCWGRHIRVIFVGNPSAVFSSATVESHLNHGLLWDFHRFSCFQWHQWFVEKQFPRLQAAVWSSRHCSWQSRRANFMFHATLLQRNWRGRLLTRTNRARRFQWWFRQWLSGKCGKCGKCQRF